MSGSVRATAQQHPGKVAVGSLAAGAALASVIIAGFEGERTHAYLDVTGTPTVCYGETAGVKIGDVHTHADCLNLLSKDVQARIPAMQKCLQAPVSQLTAKWMISYGYNAGVGRFCRTVTPLANAGRMIAACAAMGVPTTSKGIVFPGLVRRRKAEFAGCLQGLA